MSRVQFHCQLLFRINFIVIGRVLFQMSSEYFHLYIKLNSLHMKVAFEVILRLVNLLLLLSDRIITA